MSSKKLIVVIYSLQMSNKHIKHCHVPKIRITPASLLSEAIVNFFEENELLWPVIEKQRNIGSRVKICIEMDYTHTYSPIQVNVIFISISIRACINGISSSSEPWWKSSHSEIFEMNLFLCLWSRHVIFLPPNFSQFSYTISYHIIPVAPKHYLLVSSPCAHTISEHFLLTWYTDCPIPQY